MTEPTRKVNNPLFTASVTGGTYEDFSQHAVILPAQEPAQKPSVNVSQVSDQPAFLQPTAELYEYASQATSLTPEFSEYPPQSQHTPVIQPHIPQQQQQHTQPQHTPVIQTHSPQNIPQNQQASSTLTSVFSSFSNITGAFTKLTTNAQPAEEDIVVAPPAGIETLLAQNNADIQSVPLFPVVSVAQPVKPTLNQGPVNTFRRSTGLKRPIYAQIPDLAATPSTQFSTNSLLYSPSNPQSYNSPNPPPSNRNIPPESVPQFYIPQTSDYQNSPTVQQNLSTNQFKPISPIPSIPSSISHPVALSFQDPVKFNLSTSQISSPVMSAIPQTEANMADNTHMPNFNSDSTDGLSTPITNQVYRPVYHHWFHNKEIEGKTLWQPFSMADSLSLEGEFTSNDLDPDKVIPTDGGRYDVNILRRQRIPVYWKGQSTEVRRCSWFHKGHSNGRFAPYEENVAARLEDEYRTAFETNEWHRKVELENGETVVFHGPDVLVLFPPSQSPDAWGNQPNQSRPRVVKRGMDEFDIDDGEPTKVDHLLFMVHGIGSVCDLKFRPVEEAVEEFRSIARQLVQSHYRSSCEKGIANRVEVLPVSWHEQLHSEDTGIDKQLKNITLDSIPRLRDFTNDTLLDILFYTSPIYCQNIISTVGNEINRIYELFKVRNPSFEGGVSLGGHSLGSLILFDLLGHQKPPEPEEANTEEDVVPPLLEKPSPSKRKMARRISYMMGSVGTGQPQIQYPQLSFQPKAFFALGSPIGMFVTVRGLDNLGENFSLPTCPAFFNIFHPYDPVAYRIESLVNPDLSTLKPVLIPHHKGRKRMHLELRETMSRVGADLKQKVIDSMKSTWNSFYQLAMFHKADQPPSLEEEVNKAFQTQMEEPEMEEVPQEQTDLPLGALNKGRRIDYVLQEAPLEFFNEYIFALTSHVCYWVSEDTVLLMLKEIYSSMKIATDSQIPQQTMKIERSRSPLSSVVGMDPTMPKQSTNLGPPPFAGFVKKT